MTFRMVTPDGEENVIPKSDQLERMIGKLDGVVFLMGCVVGTVTNRKTAFLNEEEGNHRSVRRGLGMFIVMKQESVEDEVKKIILEEEIECDISYIKPRSKERQSKEASLDALTKLVKVRILFFIP